MSILNVCTTELEGRFRHHHQQQGQKMTYYYQRKVNSSEDSYDSHSLYTSSTRNSSFEVIFSRLLDALIFTSAIAITAYSYLTGTLVPPFIEQPAPPKPVKYQLVQKRDQFITNDHHSYDSIENQKRKRTEEWAEQQLVLPVKSHSSSNSHHRHHSHSMPSSTKKRSSSIDSHNKKVQPMPVISSRDNNMKREKKRTQSLPSNNANEEKEDELISRLQYLIQQGQDALKSPVQ